MVLAKLFAAFPALASGETSTDLRIAAYMEAVESIPAWAVAQARDAVIRGETVCDPRFAPTPPQLARLARDAMRPVAEDAADLGRLAIAAADTEPATDERERVAAGFDDLLHDLGGRSKAEEARAVQDRFLALCAAAGVDPETVPDASEKAGTFRRAQWKATI